MDPKVYSDLNASWKYHGGAEIDAWLTAREINESGE